MPDFLHIVSAGGKTGDGNLAAGVCTVRPGNQGGAGRIGVDSKPPAGQVLAVLCGFRQADIAQRGSLDFEIAIETAASRIVQRNGCLIAGAGHIPDVVTGIGGRGDIPGCGEYRGLGNIAGFCDVQRVAAFAEAGSVSVGKTEIGQYPVGIVGAAGIPGELNGGSTAAGTAAEAGNGFRCLNGPDQIVIAGSEAGQRGRPGVVEHIPGGAALVGAVAVEAVGVPQAADDFINQYLSCHPQGHIGIAVPLGGGDADGMVPLLVAVEQDQANGLPPCRGQRIPDVAAGGAAAAVQGHIPVNGIAGGAGPVVPPGLYAVQRFIRMGNPAIPCKVPAHIFNISRPGRAAAVGLIGAGHLIIQPGGIVAVVRIVE